MDDLQWGAASYKNQMFSLTVMTYLGFADDGKPYHTYPSSTKAPLPCRKGEWAKVLKTLTPGRTYILKNRYLESRSKQKTNYLVLKATEIQNVRELNDELWICRDARDRFNIPVLNDPWYLAHVKKYFNEDVVVPGPFETALEAFWTYTELETRNGGYEFENEDGRQTYNPKIKHGKITIQSNKTLPLYTEKRYMQLGYSALAAVLNEVPDSELPAYRAAFEERMKVIP